MYLANDNNTYNFQYDFPLVTHYYPFDKTVTSELRFLYAYFVLVYFLIKWPKFCKQKSRLKFSFTVLPY